MKPIEALAPDEIALGDFEHMPCRFTPSGTR
jgi:hypothetical protein